MDKAADTMKMMRLAKEVSKNESYCDDHDQLKHCFASCYLLNALRLTAKCFKDFTHCHRMAVTLMMGSNAIIICSFFKVCIFTKFTVVLVASYVN